MIKITHLTSVHPRYDTRIFLKMCSSLAKNENYQVNLIVADNKGNEVKNSVKIVDVGAKKGGRLSRMTKTVSKVLEKAKELDSDIYHFHDPELLPIGLKLKKLGKKVIFDAHEDFPKQLLDKPYLNKFLLKILSKTITIYENYACKKFDYIISATPYINEKFLAINKKSENINNFPIIGELSNETPWDQKENEVCYVGGIAKIRGIVEIVRALEYTNDIMLNLGGILHEKDTKDEIKHYDGWKKVNEFGFVNRNTMADILKRSKVGLVIFHPLPNHIDAQPNKMFEYMSGGLPIITSNFPLWKEIVEGNNCGICVDPLDPKAIADTINYIISHPQEAAQMGANGEKAVLEKYNWSIEEQKLYKLYKELE